jgi:hypothetical protein
LLKRTLLGAVAVCALMTGAANAQNRVPTGSTISTPAQSVTYSAAFTAIAPAASATDFMTLTGSASMVVRLKHVECSGTSTAAAVGTINAVVRSTADTAGTVITPSATAGGQVVPHDSNDSAGTAAVAAYSANPTTGTLTGIVRSGKLATSTAASSAITAPALVWDFGDNPLLKPVVLRGVAQQFALNGGGATFSAGTSLSCSITWIESGV